VEFLQLQWGHGDEAVEEPCGTRRQEFPESRFNGATAMKPWKRRGFPILKSSGTGFNGATAMKPWKSRSHAAIRPKNKALQWGHGDEVVEERAASIPPPAEANASMGPRR